ncbi:MAG TPA: biopolymer transporter ExbD [Chitinophagaceae bacterium]|jgi:biopolymer transport protein ExbD|nr:biopolymer transporter ExbD [Chitinophagaceae bacterium]MBP9739625.1 biopolymer transporter ExbD [Chitinophagaceae bacterium]HPH23312.1 biopolymer transporter ExbD [Chitinophagaceae bacterium]
MARPKIPRKSTVIDMTAMCDVAFLLLSFFILTTKFKPAEAITVTPPSSVSSKVAPEKDIVLITIDKDGKVFLSMDDEQKKEFIANTLNNTKGLGLNVNAFKKAQFFGASFAQLNQFLALPEDQRKGANLPGIPCKDSTNNEMIQWMTIVRDSYKGQVVNLLVKGDNDSKYPSFKNVMSAFKKNDFLKFQLVTNPESVPVGTELYKNPPTPEKK